jgi:hypothetical protein
MTDLLPEFASIPAEGVFDGELVAFDADGLPVNGSAILIGRGSEAGSSGRIRVGLAIKPSNKP